MSGRGEASGGTGEEGGDDATSTNDEDGEGGGGGGEGVNDDDDGTADGATAGPLGISVQPENFELLLPSGLPPHLRAICNKDLLDQEKHIRIALLDSIICSLRKNLRLKSSLYRDKKAHQFGQKAGTRSNVNISNFTAKLDSDAQRYRDVRTALLNLDPQGSWRSRLKSLHKDDVRAAQHDIDEREKRRKKGLGEGKRELSWIYRMKPEGIEDKEDDKYYSDGKSPE